MDFTTIINKTADRINEPENRVRLVVTTFLDAIRNEVIKGNEVNLPYFGNFCVKHVSQKRVVSPMTDKIKIIPAHNTVRFITNKSFKRAVEDQGRV